MEYCIETKNFPSTSTTAHNSTTHHTQIDSLGIICEEQSTTGQYLKGNMKKDEIPPKERGDTVRESSFVSPLFSNPIFAQLHEGMENVPTSSSNSDALSNALEIQASDNDQDNHDLFDSPTNYVSECRPGSIFSTNVKQNSPNRISLRPKKTRSNNEKLQTFADKKMNSPKRNRIKKNSRLQMHLNKNETRIRRRRKSRKYLNNIITSYDQLWVPITPQMIIRTLQRLNCQNDGVKLTEIVTNMRLFYPLRPNPDDLSQELRVKMNCALKSGIIKPLMNNSHRFIINRDVPLHKKVLNEFWLRYRELPENPPTITKSELDLLRSASVPSTQTNSSSDMTN